MKKKLSGIVFAIALICSCLIFLASCGEDQINIDSIYVKINEDRNGYLGTFDYGQQVDFNNVKIMAKYSDGSEKDVTKDENLTVTYSYDNGENKPIGELSNSPDVGHYDVTFKYGEHETGLNFQVQQAQYKSGYKISLDKQTWNYDQAPATVALVSHPDNVDNSIEAYYITKENYEDYNAYEKEDEKEEFLNSNSCAFPEEIYDILPGEYYAYARVSETANYKESLSNLVRFVVNKGTLTQTDDANCTSFSFTYTTEIGDINLNSIGLGYDSNHTQFVDANGKKVNGSYSWVNPEINVNYSNSGNGYRVQFVPDNNYWNTANYGMVKISIEQGKVEIPSGDYTNDTTYNANMTQLDLFQINNNPESFLAWIDITKSVNDGEFERCDTIVRNEELISDNSVDNIGKYTYKLSLKDKTNYCWSTNSSTDDLVYTFNVNKIPSYILEEYKDGSWVLDPQGKVKIEIDTTSADYIEDTLNVTRLNNLYNYDTPTSSTIDCTLDLVSENGKTYLIVTVKGFTNNQTYGSVGIGITATGTNNYEDVDYKFNITICKYDSYELLSNAIRGFETASSFADANRQIYLPVGTKISDIFTNNLLTNEYGHIKVEISVDEKNWAEVTDADKVTELCQTYARFVFASNNEVCCESISNTPDYLIHSDYSKSKQTLTKDTVNNYVSKDASGIWLYFDISKETSGNNGYVITLTASGVSSAEIPVVFNVYSGLDGDLIHTDSSPLATIDDFEPTGNPDEYSLTINSLHEYHIYIYVELSGNVDVDFCYSVAPRY